MNAVWLAVLAAAQEEGTGLGPFAVEFGLVFWTWAVFLVLLFLLLFSWTVSLLTVVGVRLLRAGTIDLLGAVAGSALTWSVGAYGAAWISGAAVLFLIGIYGRREGRLA